MHELGDELLAVLLHGLANQLLPHLKVLLVLQGDAAQVRAPQEREVGSKPQQPPGSGPRPGA